MVSRKQYANAWWISTFFCMTIYGTPLADATARAVSESDEAVLTNPGSQPRFLRDRIVSDMAMNRSHLDSEDITESSLDPPDADSANATDIESVDHVATLVPSSDNNESEYVSQGLFDWCYHDLLHASRDGTSLQQQDYLKYLEVMSDGHVSFTLFAQLPAFYSLLFYAAACPAGYKCNHYQPSIALELSGKSRLVLETFCGAIVSNTFALTEVSFDYSVRYNGHKLPVPQVKQCLTQATKSVLVQAHLQCNVAFGDRRKLRMTSPTREGSRLSSFDRILGENQPCYYTFQHHVDKIHLLPCPSDSNAQCGLVQNTVLAMVLRETGIISEDLNKEITGVLRRAIDTKAFESFVPTSCKFD